MPNASKFGRGSRLKPEQRLFVESMLATQTPASVIKREGAKKFGKSENTIENWISQVYELLGAEADPIKKDERRALMRQALGDFYQKALLARQFNAAVTALDRLCKLDGLYRPEEVEVFDKRGVAERDPDKIRERMRELSKRPEIRAMLDDPSPGEDPVQ